MFKMKRRIDMGESIGDYLTNRKTVNFETEP